MVMAKPQTVSFNALRSEPTMPFQFHSIAQENHTAKPKVKACKNILC